MSNAMLHYVLNNYEGRGFGNLGTCNFNSIQINYGSFKV